MGSVTPRTDATFAQVPNRLCHAIGTVHVVRVVRTQLVAFVVLILNGRGVVVGRVLMLLWRTWTFSAIIHHWVIIIVMWMRCLEWSNRGRPVSTPRIAMTIAMGMAATGILVWLSGCDRPSGRCRSLGLLLRWGSGIQRRTCGVHHGARVLFGHTARSMR